MIVLRLLIFPFVAGAVAFFISQRRRNGRHQSAALLISIATVAVGALGAVTSPDPSMVVLINLILLMTFGCLLYVFADVGFYFSKDLGQFWIRGASGSLRYQLLFVCLLSTLGIVLYTGIVYRGLHSPVEGADLITSKAIIHFFARNMAFVVSEELAYRGCFQPLLAHFLRETKFNMAFAVFVVSLAFAGQHVGINETAVMLTTFPVGLALGCIFIRYGLLPAILVHFTSNLLLGAMLPSIVARL